MPHANPTALLVLATLALGACRSSDHLPSARAPENALAFETLLQGYQSGVHSQSAELLASREQWIAFWKRHASWRVAAPEAPAVDFAAHSVLAVCLGDRPSGGFGVDVCWVAPAKAGLVVHAVERKPHKGMLVPQVVTQPYQIVLVPPASGSVALELE